MTAKDLDFGFVSNLESALFFAGRGWRVHPVWGMFEGVCLCPDGEQCGEKNRGKHPIEGAWQKKATTDEKSIRRWWKQHPLANVGIATGKDSGIFVVDIDGPAGRESLKTLPQIPDTFTVSTGSGGLHFYFQYPPDFDIRNKQGHLPGIDIRGEGGYVLAPYSMHRSGNRYAFVDRNAAVSAYEHSAIFKPKEHVPIAPPVAPSSTSDQTKQASSYLSKMPPAISGSGGHDATFKAALVLMKGFKLSTGEAMFMLQTEFNPRCQPPWSEKELRHKLNEAEKSSRLPEGFLVRPPHLRAVDSKWDSLKNFTPSAPPSDYQPPPLTDEDAPPELMTLTADEFERLLDDDISNAVRPDVLNRAIALRQNPEEWLKIGQILRRKKIKKEFDAAIKKHDRGPLQKKSGWQSQLLFKEDKNGFPVLENCLNNIAEILTHDPSWVGVLSYDEFLNRIVVIGETPFKRRTKRWIDADSLEVVSWIERNYSIRPKVEITTNAILLVANRQATNCQTAYLDSLESHDKEILDSFLVEHFGCDDNAYTRAIFSKWMIGLVARAYDPGCKFDTALILEGGQGLKKSRFFEQLCPNLEWFIDGLSDFGSKAQAEEVEGKWVVEIAELSGFAKADIEKIKSFVTRKAENYRPAYGRFNVHSPRRFALGGTINPGATGYLKDDENRRFWPVACKKRGQEITPELRDMLMSEARDRYKNGEKFWIEESEVEALFRQEQDKRREVDPWQEKIEESLIAQVETSTQEILQTVIHLDLAKRTSSDERRVGSILKRIGWVKKRPTIGGRRVWRYYSPHHPRLIEESD